MLEMLKWHPWKPLSRSNEARTKIWVQATPAQGTGVGESSNSLGRAHSIGLAQQLCSNLRPWTQKKGSRILQDVTALFLPPGLDTGQHGHTLPVLAWLAQVQALLLDPGKSPFYLQDPPDYVPFCCDLLTSACSLSSS